MKGSGTTADRSHRRDRRRHQLGGVRRHAAEDGVEAHFANNAISGRANGEFQGSIPRITANPRFKGKVTGTVDAASAWRTCRGPITPDAVTADGRLTLAKSEVGGLKIDAADIQGQYANRRGTLRQATVKGPDIEVTASGPIALDQTGQTNLKYHVAATNLENLGKLANQPGLAGSAMVDGTMTGNAGSLKIAGTVDGSNVGYQDNKALDLNSNYTVTVPDLEFARAQVQARDQRDVRRSRRDAAANGSRRTTTYEDKRLNSRPTSPSRPPLPKAPARQARRAASASSMRAVA